MGFIEEVGREGETVGGCFWSGRNGDCVGDEG